MKMAQALAESFAASSRNTSCLQNRFSSQWHPMIHQSVVVLTILPKGRENPKSCTLPSRKPSKTIISKRLIHTSSTHVCSISSIQPFWCPESSRTWYFLTFNTEHTMKKNTKHQVKCDCRSVLYHGYGQFLKIDFTTI